MRMPLTLILTAALLLGSCAGSAHQPRSGQSEIPTPPAAEQQAPIDPPPSLPAPAAGVIRSGSRWEVPRLKHGPVWYIWSPDRAWVAFHLNSGLWAVSADGRTERHLVRGEAVRELVGWWQGGLVYLEHRNGDVVVGLARPGQEVREITTLPLRRASNYLFIGNYAIFGDHLALFPDDRAPLRVHLGSGSVQELGSGAMPARCSAPMPSPDQRYVLCLQDLIRLIDLETWTLKQIGDGGYTVSAAWSPAENRWAALVGPQGTGSAERGIYASHLDLGDVQGQVVQLKPPQPMKLIGTPYWSADGRYLAVVSEAKPASDGRGRDAVTELWMVTPATGEWRKLVTMQFVHPQGWHPSGKYLVVWRVVGSAAPPEIGTMDAETGSVTWLSLPPMEQRDATRLDERLLVVSGAPMRPAGEAAVLQIQPGKPPLALAPGQLPYKDALQVRPPFVSWIDYEKGTPSPSLVVEHRPGEEVK